MKEELRVQLLLNQLLLNHANTHNMEVHENEAGDGTTSVDSSSLSLSSSSAITPTLLLSAFVAVLGSFTFGLVTGYTSPVQAHIMSELNLSTAEFSLFGSMNSIGGLLGAIVCGRLTDYLGRKHILRVTDVFYIFGWFAIAVAQGARLLYLGRWMLGLATGITCYAVPVYIAEFAPKNLRGGFVILHVLMVTAGASAAFLIGLVTSWRTLAAIGIVPSLVQIVSLWFIPESPRWLLMMNKSKEFEATLQRLRGGSVNISEEVADIRECTEALDQIEKVGITQLFRKKYAYVLTVGFGLSALNSFVGLSGIIFYASYIFESAGFSATAGSIALALFQLPSVGLGVILMDKCGRRPLLMISVVGLCLGCLLTGLGFVFKEHHLMDGFSPYMALIGILIYMASYPIGMGGASSVVISEIYPLNVKGLAGSISTIINFLSTWIVSYAFNFSMEWSSSGTFFMLAGVCAMTLVFVAKLVPETKGRTLEEIHISISNVWQ